MHRAKAISFIENEIKGLFPAWKPTVAEAGIWADELELFDYAAAQSALRSYIVSEKGSFNRPKLYHIIKECKKNQSYTVKRSEPVKLFIMRNMGNGKNMTFWVGDENMIPNGSEVLARAERMKHNIKQLYGGNWIAEIAEGILE